MSQSIALLPVRMLKSLGRGAKAIFGPLITAEFWIKVVMLCAKEMVSAFMKTLGGKFLSYGVQGEDPEIKKAAQQFNTINTPAPAGFSSGYQRPEFRNDYGANYSGYRSPVPVVTPSSTGSPLTQQSSGQVTNFPGFNR